MENQIKKASSSKKFRGKGKFSNRNVRWLMRMHKNPIPEPLEECDFLNSNINRQILPMTRKDAIKQFNQDLDYAKYRKNWLTPKQRVMEREFYESQKNGLESQTDYC